MTTEPIRINVPPELLPALAIFVRELDSHVVFIRETLDHLAMHVGSTSEALSEENAEILEHRFHVIKGGAGFFHLDDLRTHADRGERIARAGELHNQTTLSELKTLVVHLSNHASELKQSFPH